VLRAVRALLPREDLVYLADQANVPYGDRSEDDLVRLLARNVALLRSEGVEAIVMGCNTTCAVAAKRGWPAGLPILDLIAAAAGEIGASGRTRIGVLGTTATVRSGAYGAAIRARSPSALVQEVAAPRLVPLVEVGLTEGDAAHAAVREALAAFEGPLDALVYACSHYPLLDDVFADVLGSSVARIDPAPAQARRTAAWAGARPNAARAECGRTRYLTTGPLQPFRDSLAAIVGLGEADSVASCDAEARSLS
jgi:glutamate racemase